jgi:hypothetical protein
MRDLTPSSAPRSRAFVSTSVLANGVLFTQMGGYIDAELCERQLTEFRSALEQHPGGTWIIEVERLLGFDPKAVKAGANWFSVFKSMGGQRVVYVSRSSTARMAAQALGFGAGIKVICVDGVEQARESLGLNRQSA